MAEVGADAALKGKRVHTLDYLRCMFVTGALYLHVWQIFGGGRAYVTLDTAMFAQFQPSSPYYELLNQDMEGWRHDYAQRIIMIGRQIVIPLIFWISGMSLGLSGEKATSIARKLLIITIVGTFMNATVYIIGPMDDRCDWTKGGLPTGQYYDICTEKGLLINFGIGIGAGPVFQVLFQFWFTAFLLIFVLQAHPLAEALRGLNKASAGEEWDRRSVAINVVVYWVVTGGSYVALTHLWSPTDVRRASGVQMALLEPLFIAALVAAAYLPPSQGRLVRLCQYLGGLSIIVSFCIPDVGSGVGMDGALVTYYHVFKQFFLLGFAMSATRKKTQPIASRVYPIALILVILTFPPTNYYRAGVDTYPRFPYVLDRVLWTGGAVIWAFCFDRLSLVVAENGSLRPLFPGWNLGALVAYVSTEPLMALLSPVIRRYPHMDPVVWALIMFFLYAIPLGIMQKWSARTLAAPRPAQE